MDGVISRYRDIATAMLNCRRAQRIRRVCEVPGSSLGSIRLTIEEKRAEGLSGPRFLVRSLFREVHALHQVLKARLCAQGVKTRIYLH